MFMATVVTWDDKTSCLFTKFSDFENISDQVCISTTGFSKDELIFITSELKSLNNSPCRSIEQAVAVYLNWLKTGNSQDDIALNFGLKSRMTVQNLCASKRSK